VTDWLPFLASYKWPWYMRVYLNLGIGVAGFLACVPFWRTSSSAYRKQVERFFTIMRTPVDFAREVGEATDLTQLRIVGGFCAVIGVCICSLMLVGNPLWGRLSILFIGGFVAAVGSALFWVGSRAADSLPADGIADEAGREAAAGDVEEP